MTDHYREAEMMLDLARAHTDTGDKRNEELAALFTARAQVHATLALAARRGRDDDSPASGPVLCGCREQREATGDLEGCYCSCADNPDAGPCDHEAVPLWRAAETWGDDIEVQSVEHPDVRWRVRGGRFLITGGNKWRDLTRVSGAMVTLVSREPYRDDPWEPGQDVTGRLAAGETAPEGTILRDCDGDIYRAESGGRFTDWRKSRGGWWPEPDWAWNRNAMGRLSNYAPLRVATPEQIRAAGIEVPS